MTIQPTFLSDALGYSSASTFTGSPSYTPAVGQKNINVNPSMFIFVTSPSLVQQTNFQALRGSLEPANVICAVDVDVPPRCYIHKDFSVPSVTKFQNTTLSTIQFDLINSRGTSLIGFDLPWCMQFDIFEKVIDVGILEQTIDTYFSKPENSILQSNLLDYALMSDIDPKDLREFESEKEKQIRELNILKEKIMKKQK